MPALVSQVGRVLTAVSLVMKNFMVITVNRNVDVKMVLHVIQYLGLASVLLGTEDLSAQNHAQMEHMVNHVPIDVSARMVALVIM